MNYQFYLRDKGKSPHAVSGFDGNSYSYDLNGNQTTRNIGNDSYTLIFDEANHLVEVDANQPFPTPQLTATPTPTVTPTPSMNFTVTPTVTQTPTETETPTVTPTPTITETPTETPASSQTGTASPTNTETPQPTQTPTIIPTSTTTPSNGLVEYIYDGDGNLVKSIINGVETYYPNANYQFQITGSLHVETKYYSAGSSRIAYRIDGEITWLLIDHLGSTVGTVNADGDLIDVLKYSAYGELRSGNSTTDYRYTGQREEAEIGLYYYVARFYDPAIGRFISADSLIPDPGSSQGFDRYAYVDNSPVNYNDPSGHMVDDGCTTEGCSYSDYEYMQDVQKNQLLEIQASQRSCQSGVDTYCSSVEAVLMHYPKLVTGVSISYSGQAGYGAEAGGQYEKSFIMDWSEGNLYITDNAGAFVYGGTPTGLGGEFQATLFVLHGIPHDLKDISDKLRGNQVFGSPELGLDSIIGASASGLLSVDIDQDGNPIYKQGSGYQYSSGLSFSLTGNEIPNGIEAGLKLGWVSNISVKRIPLR